MKRVLTCHGLIGLFGLMLLISPKAGAQTPAPTPAPVPAAPAPAQEPQALSELRRKHLLDLEKSDAVMARKEIEAVEALEKERAEKGDYLGAERAVRRADELKKTLEKPGATRPGSIRLNTQVQHKSFYGVEEKNGLFKLGKTNSFVQWDVSSIAQGSYEVILHYAATLTDLLGAKAAAQRTASGVSSSGTVGGEVEFSQESSLAAAVKKVQRIAPTETAGKVEALSLGVIDVTSKSATFKLRAALAQPDGLMVLHSVELTPASAAKRDVDPPEFTREKAAFRQSITAKVKSLHEQWVRKLQALEKEYEESGNVAALAETRKELGRMKAYVGTIPVAAANGASRPGGPYTLSAADPLVALAGGEIRVDEKKEWLLRLRPAGSQITFGLDKCNPKVPPGTYTVKLLIRTGPASGGEVQIKCGSSTLNQAIASTTTVTERELPIGPALVVGAEEQDRTLSLTVHSLKSADGSLCDLKAVILTPSAAAPPRKTPGSGASETPKAKAEI